MPKKSKRYKDMTLAEKISSILHDPELPEPLYDGFQHALSDFFNVNVDQAEVHAFERSPTYINFLLRGYIGKVQRSDAVQ